MLSNNDLFIFFYFYSVIEFKNRKAFIISVINYIFMINELLKKCKF